MLHMKKKIYETELLVQIYYSTIFLKKLSNIIGLYIEYAPLIYCFSWKQTAREGKYPLCFYVTVYLKSFIKVFFNEIKQLGEKTKNN